MDNRNTKLLLKIIEFHGKQWRFAHAINEHESIVSKVVRQKIELSDGKKQIWAKALNCEVAEIFS